MKIPEKKVIPKASQGALEAGKTALANKREWDSHNYDGILGTPPDWMNKVNRNEFERLQCELLVVKGFLPIQILQFLESLAEQNKSLDDARPDTFTTYNLTPIPHEIRKDIEGLLLLRTAINAGPVKGVEMLLGSDFAKEVFTSRKFTAGRKSTTIGPIRKFIKSMLKQNHSYKNQEIWEVLKMRPPRGWTVMENSQGRYIEGPKPINNVGWRRFCNLAAEERNFLKNSPISEGVKVI